VPTYDHFDDMGLKEDVLRGVYSYGFERPSTIQQHAIVQVSQGHDLIAQAQSGTGKTGAFTIGLLERIDVSKKAPQVIVLSPTRELARQSNTVINCIGDHLGVRTSLAIGGSRTNYDELRRAHVIVGTPGRTLDLLTKVSNIQRDICLLVVDEADEMLSAGFEEQMYNVFQQLPTKMQVCLFSATMPQQIVDLSEKFMKPDRLTSL